MMTPELNFDPVEEPLAPEITPVVLIMPDPVTEEDETRTREFFKKLSPDQREDWRARYEYLLKAEAGLIPTKVNPLTRKPIEYTKAEWMVPAWESGLRILIQVIKDENNILATKIEEGHYEDQQINNDAPPNCE